MSADESGGDVFECGRGELRAKHSAGEREFRRSRMPDAELCGPFDHVAREHRHNQRHADHHHCERGDIPLPFCRNRNKTAAETDQQKRRDRIDGESEEIEQHTRDFCAERADEVAHRFGASSLKHGKIRRIV